MVRRALVRRAASEDSSWCHPNTCGAKGERVKPMGARPWVKVPGISLGVYDLIYQGYSWLMVR